MTDNMEKPLVFQKVVEYMILKDHEGLGNLTIAMIAKEFSLSRFQLWRRFKREMGVSLEDYLIRLKINRAAELLTRNNEMTVKEISEKIGYYRCDYFIKIFKKYYGVTPGRYRYIRQFPNSMEIVVPGGELPR